MDVRGDPADRASLDDSLTEAATPPRQLLVLLLSAATLSTLAASIFISSLPYMARDLGTTLGMAQLTITVYLVAFGPSALFVGALSDYIGRRAVLLASLALFSLSSAACALAPSIEALLSARAVEAVGACAGIVVTRAMLRDTFGRDGTPRVMSILSISMVSMPILGAVLGGHLQAWFGWRASFVVLAGGGGTLLAAMWLRLPGIAPGSVRFARPLRAGFITNLVALLRNPWFVGYTCVIAASGAASYSFTSFTPGILIAHFGLTPTAFGWITALSFVGILIGLFFTNRLVARLGIKRLIFAGSGLLLASGAATTALSPISQAWAVIAPLIFMNIAIGLLAPNGHSGAIGSRPDIAGVASGLSVLMQMTYAGAITAIVAVIPHDTALGFGVILVALGLMSFAGLWLARRS